MGVVLVRYRGNIAAGEALVGTRIAEVRENDGAGGRRDGDGSIIGRLECGIMKWRRMAEFSGDTRGFLPSRIHVRACSEPSHLLHALKGYNSDFAVVGAERSRFFRSPAPGPLEYHPARYP